LTKATRNEALQYIHQQSDRLINDLVEWVKIPSVSTDSNHKKDMERAAGWVASYLRSIGMSRVEVFSTPLHPIVFAELCSDQPDAQTVLIYGHYDVQPVDPIHLWKNPPFDPTVEGDYLYGRGVSDMKGQVIACIGAVEAIVKQGPYPIHLKFLLEGEEEIGSPNLPNFMEQHTELLASDFALNADTGMISADVPTITYSLRGLAYFELQVFGPENDLHSGQYGGVIHNPAQVLADLISGMHDPNGRILLPGFYDRVVPLGDEERHQLARLPINREELIRQTGVQELWGEAGFTPVEQLGARPTLEINGMLSGFTGSGAKTVIPAWAMAKISMRLVPDQDPEEVKNQLTQYIQAKVPPTVRWELKTMTGGKASLSDRTYPATQAMYRALKEVWGKDPVYRREGGSVPVVGDMQTILGIESVLTGFGLPDDNIHAPNERLHLPTWYRGIDALVLFFYDLLER
jgi:acetylornithine deacetylase/succinyl-diaminopimelate desuccinylase-like protein